MEHEDTYRIPEIRWWGLPVGLAFMVGGGAATFYVNQGITGGLTGLVGAIAFLVLVTGIIAFGAFVYSIIAHGVGRTEAKTYIPSGH
ncbi:MAG TPA: hypothetical protein VF808_07165 [Ktedonobacterales bacterium]